MSETPFLTPEAKADVSNQLKRRALRAVRDGGIPIDGGVKLIEHLTEVDAAKAFAREYGDRIRYCKKAGGWFSWDGQRWKLDDDDSVNRLAEEYTAVIAEWANGITDLDERKKVLTFAIKLRKRWSVENVVAIAQWQSGIAIGNPERFDADQWLLNVNNGTIDLRTGQLHPHDRQQLLTKLVPIDYLSDATCPRFQRFLDEIFDGDAETIDFVQRAFGYSLSGSTREQVFLVLYGIGANGKSTLLSVIGKCLGDYGLTTDSETFVARQAGSQTNDLARLRGARFVFAIETSEGKSLAENFVKAVTGGDKISARFLFQEFFDFEPAFKLWLGTNHKPLIKGGDEGIWRRVRLVPFEQRFEGDRCDLGLSSKLESELPGILAWAVCGCIEWQKRGLKAPKAVNDATAAYRSEMDTFSGFVDEKCCVAPNMSAGARELYQAYKSWAEANGEKGLSQRWFGLRLTERDFRNEKDRKGRKYWRGIGLRMEDDG